MVEMEPGQGNKLSTDNLGIQVSFLYTNQYRERMLRIINHSVVLSNDQRQIYESCDYLAITNGKEMINLIYIALMRKHAGNFYSTTSLIDLNREFLNNAKSVYQQGTQVLKEDTEVLDMFPLSILGAMKHPTLNLHCFKSNIKSPYKLPKL